MSLLRYPEYKDSGVDWLGEMPGHWRISALKHLADYQNGYPFKPEEWSDEGRPIIRIAQLTSGAEPNFFDGEIDKRNLVNNGDLLFSWSASIDAYIWDQKDAWLNQHIFKVSPDSGVSKKFLFHLIRYLAPKLADIDAHGSTMRHIKKESLAQHVALPPLSEQGAIANFLDLETEKIDVLISEQQRLVELLAEKRQAVISHAITKGLNPNAKMKDSGIEWLGDVPEHWVVMPLKRDLQFLTSGSRGWADHYADDGALFIRIGNLPRNDIHLDLSDIQRVDVPNGTEGERTKVQAGDVLFSITAYLGSVAIVPEDLETAYVSQHVALARLSSQTLFPSWVAYLTLSFVGKTYLETQGYGGAKVQLSLDDVRNIPMLVPSLDEQRTIVSFLEAETTKLDTLTAEASRAIELLQERRSALISAAVTGKIDVRTLASSSQADIGDTLEAA
jgi:type I restriction enzyme S subunit